MVSIRKIASIAGVSTATVSRVINGSKSVSESTRKLVLKVIRENNYKPKPNYGKDGTLLRTIGVIVPNIRAYHYPQILTGIYETAYENGFDVMMSLAKDRPLREIEILDEYFNRKVDGILFCTLKCNEQPIEKFVDSGIPVVAVDQSLEEINVDSVNIDNVMGGYSVLRFLQRKGHRRVIHLRGQKGVYASIDRENGIEKYLRRHKDIEVVYTKTCGYEPEHGYAGIMEMKDKLHEFTAVFAVNDYVAIGAIKAINELGFRVPEDVSVVGFDDSPFAQYTVPSLTTVAQPRFEMGTVATKLLLERLQSNRNKVFRNVVLPTKIVERKSVKSIVATPEVEK